MIALPPDADVADACAALSAAIGQARLTFVDLARAAGNEALAEVHERWSEELGL